MAAFGGGGPRACYLCDTPFPLGETFFSDGRRALCGECADGVSVEDMMLLTGTRNTRDMLATLGFARDFI